MPKKNYLVALSEEEIRILQNVTHNGNSHSAKEILHANILLLAAKNRPKGQKGGSFLCGQYRRCTRHL